MAKFQFQTAWHRVRRSPFQALAAFSVLVVTFFVITSLSVIIFSSEKVLKYFETRPQVIAFLKDGVADEDITSLTDKLKANDKVAEVEYVTKEEALEIYKRATSDNPLLTELISPSIFPASIEVSLKNLNHAQDVIGEIKNESIVDQVGFTASLEGESGLNDVIERLRKISYYIRAGGIIFAGILISMSFLVLIVIIGMRITSKKAEIEILNLIGATSAFIMNPIILEAFMYVFGGIIVGWLLTFILVLYTTPTVVSYFGEVPILPRDTLELIVMFLMILAGEFVVGAVLALTGSLLAVSRARKRK